MKTSVVIATKNSVATIRQCLASLMPYYEQGYIDEIVVVDANSDDGTSDVVKDFPVRLIFHDAGAEYIQRDIGWRATGGEFVLFPDSDAYLGEHFFPTIHQFFDNTDTGIVGAYERAIVTNNISKTIGEWWLYNADNLKGLLNTPPSSWSLFQRLYHKIAWGGEKDITTSGPCYIVQRTCLEAVNGFYPYVGAEDINLSRKIIEKGWKATWWLDAPLYHRTRTSIKQLLKQRHYWGKLDHNMQKSSLKAHQKVMLVISRLGMPVIGLILALRFKNPLQLVLFPLAHYAWSIGYLAALAGPMPRDRDRS